MILAASVCTREGKVLLSRQFQVLKADRVRSLLSQLPKLTSQGSQHTSVEADGVRYVYEPLEGFYVVLLTDLASNIVQDLKTLRLLAQAVAAEVPEPTELALTASAFDIIMAFEEVIAEGYAEDLTLHQVETFLEMDSHEEKIQQIIERNKELEAAEERKKKARELEQQRKAAKRVGSGSGSSGYNDGISSPFMQPPVTPQPVFEQQQHVDPNASRFGSGGLLAAEKPKGRGLQLGKKKARDEGLPLLAEVDLPGARAREAPAALGSGSGMGSGLGSAHGHGSSVAAKAATPVPEGTEVTIAEGLTVETSRDGQVRSSRVSGTLHLFAGDREHAKLQIRTTSEGPASAYKTNPKMDRLLFSKTKTLGLRNADSEFPAANVLLVKWTLDDVKPPITFNVWINEAADPGFMTLTLEYELDADFTGTLENVNVTVPLPTSNAHIQDPGSVYDQFDDHIVWMIPVLSHDEPGPQSFEFTAEADSEDDFFPMEVSFVVPRGTSTFGLLDVASVVEVPGDTPVDFQTAIEIKTDSYLIR